MLSNKLTVAIAVILIVVSFAISLYLYPVLPDQIASHWNAQGEVNGHMPKTVGILLIPVIMIILVGLFLLLPRIDPMKANVEKFRSYFNGFIILIVLFMLSIHAQMMLWGAGLQINPAATLPIGLGILFFYIGILLTHAEQNWFIGIRTPWTLSSETVWKKTHRLGGKLFKIAGIISILGVLSPYYAFVFVLAPIIIVIIVTFAYSYFEFKNAKKRPKYVTRSS